MPFSAILLVFKFLMLSFLQVCKFTDLQVHNSIDCPYFYGLSVKISDLLHLIWLKLHTLVEHNETMCHAQEPLPCFGYLWSYFPLIICNAISCPLCKLTIIKAI